MLDNSDFEILLKATLRIYQDSIRGALRGFRLNWYWAFIPVVYLLANMLLFSILPGGIVSGFILGIFFTFCISNYLALIESTVNGEKIKSLQYLKKDTIEIFLNLINVLFLLFIVSLFQSYLPPQLALAVNLLIIVCFNPILEVCYLSSSSGMESFGRALNFVKENTIEWFFPMFLLALPLIISDWSALLLQLVKGDPVQATYRFITELIVFLVGGQIPLLISFAILLILLFIFMVFRGLLFKKLNGSSRRKRIYQYRFEG
ncbi:MAG: hypothetical protein IT292_04795 [Deltaproteobacteria bacterium]|nr:hypothetical protein [Deltaproteobacteria bacterium]